MRILPLLLACLMLASCAFSTPPDTPVLASVPDTAKGKISSPDARSATPDTEALSEPELELTAEEKTLYSRADEINRSLQGSVEPEDVVRAYMELQYLGYSSLRGVDLSHALDANDSLIYNLILWQDQLIQRRRLIESAGLCYVEREIFDYDIEFIPQEEINDGRIEFWSEHDFDDGAETMLHFVIRGEPGKAYPPLMALNSQHTVRMRPEGDGWRITFHYFPGAARKFYNVYLEPRDDDEVIEELFEEFEPGDSRTTLSPKAGSTPYRGIFAARYALEFTENPNPGFYNAGDWNGNCMNFVSQCILHGFGEGKIPDRTLSRFMTDEWFAGDGGGSYAWETVRYFWDYAIEDGTISFQFPESAATLRTGDIVLTRSRLIKQHEDPEDFTHSLILVDPKNLVLAQNSPACFIYYSDLVSTNKRYLRPLYRN